MVLTVWVHCFCAIISDMVQALTPLLAPRKIDRMNIARIIWQAWLGQHGPWVQKVLSISLAIISEVSFLFNMTSPTAKSFITELSFMLMCSCLAERFAGPPLIHSVASVLSWTIRDGYWREISNSFKTFLSQTTTIQPSVRAGKLASVGLNDIYFDNLVTAYMGLLPYRTSILVQVLRSFFWANPQFESICAPI